MDESSIIHTDAGDIIDCEYCGYAHLHPLPDDSEEYYEQDRFYREHSPPDWFAKEYGEYQEGLWDTYYEFHSRLLNSDIPLIDVGAGLGTYLDYWTRHVNSRAFGVEPSDLAHQFKEAYSLSGEMIHDEKTLDAYADIAPANVRMNLVLEHIPKPVDFIKQYVPFLGNQGRLLIVVPNEFNPLQKKVGGTWWASKVHCNYFCPQSLKNLLELCGLQIVYETATFPMEIFILAGNDYRNDPALGRKLHRKRLSMEKRLGLEAFELYYALFRTFGWGRELIVVAEKAFNA